MNRFDHQWRKLTALARQAPAEPGAAAPYGFATRVAAAGLAAPETGAWFGLERLALRGLLAACGLCVASVAFHYTVGDALAEGDEEALIEFVNTDFDFS